MILVDSTVVIDYLRTADPKLIAAFTQHDAAICGVVRAEILHGARSPAHRTNLLAALDSFKQLAIPESLWDEIGDVLANFRSNGLRFPMPDVIISVLAATSGIELWARDQHFIAIQSALPALRFFAEP